MRKFYVKMIMKGHVQKMIRLAKLSDAKRIVQIYNHYIENTTVTFEEQSVSEQDMAQRMAPKIEQGRWLICEEDGHVHGYAYAEQFAQRSAWRFTLVASVYLDESCHGRGLGQELYKNLFDTLKKQEVHSVMALITMPNDKSVIMHEKMGFKKVGQVVEGGYKLGRWIDVSYWQLML